MKQLPRCNVPGCDGEPIERWDRELLEIRCSKCQRRTPKANAAHAHLLRIIWRLTCLLRQETQEIVVGECEDQPPSNADTHSEGLLFEKSENTGQ